MSAEKHPQSLAPCLLISMPQLLDPNFARSVVLLCEHSPEGAFGLVLNRPTGQKASAVIQLTPPPAGDSGLKLWVGGPVEPQRGWILLDRQPETDGVVQVSDQVFLSSSNTLLRHLLEGPPPSRCRLLVGYAGWGPGQLDHELTQSSWLIAEPNPELVFDTDGDTMWEQALRRLGVDPLSLQTSSGVH
ncbi:MAG TPA: YqgE/AlgH family protein [Acidobacteriota bacterium]